VARRVPSGHVGGHANQARIRTWPRGGATALANGTVMAGPDAMWASDAVDLAVAEGLYPRAAKAADFSFADTYDPITVVGARLCEARVWELFRRVAENGFGERYLDYAQGSNLSNRMPLFVPVSRKLTLNDTLWGMRSHYEGTWFDTREDIGAGPYHSPYRARPVTFQASGKSYSFNRNVGYVGTFFHFVAQARPAEALAGGIIWFGVDDAALSALTPMYALTDRAPATWAYGNGATDKFSLRSAYWAFNVVANYAYSRWD
jgi:dipeptidase